MSKQVIIPKGSFSDPVAVDVNNWPLSFPYTPKVSVSLKHDSKSVTLRFNVSEKYTKAEITANNGQVWTDSCVEFFISFDDKGYYNLETTCAGVQLLGYKDDTGTCHASDSIINSIHKKGTYVGKSFSEIVGENNWEIEIQIPVTAFFKHNLSSFDSMKVRGNFYKCGDNLSHPHFLSWSPITFPKPNFHLPEFFGDIIFQ